MMHLCGVRIKYKIICEFYFMKLFNSQKFTCTCTCRCIIPYIFLPPTAFPSPDSMLVQETSTPVRAMLAQTSPPLKCVYQKGQLSQYYSLQWFKGNILLANTAENNTNPHFSINEDYSLIIHDVVSSDAGSGYYCRVTVTDPNTGFNETATGLNIQLIVIGKEIIKFILISM